MREVLALQVSPLLLTLASVPAAAQSSIPEFLEASKPWLLTEPQVLIEEAVGDSARMVIVGYDPTTGAWFNASAAFAGGRDPSGRSYYILPGDTEPHTPVHEPLPYFIGTKLPRAMLGAMHERPDSIVAAALEGDVWSVTYLLVTDQTADPSKTFRYIARFDAVSGRIRSHERDHPIERNLLEFDWSNPEVEQIDWPESLPQFSVRFQDDVSLEDFEIESVVPWMKTAGIAVEQRLAAVAAGYTPDDSGNWTPPDPSKQPVVPYGGQTARRFRTPLIIGGILIVAVAGFEGVRRRMQR